MLFICALFTFQTKKRSLECIYISNAIYINNRYKKNCMPRLDISIQGILEYATIYNMVYYTNVSIGR